MGALGYGSIDFHFPVAVVGVFGLLDVRQAWNRDGIECDFGFPDQDRVLERCEDVIVQVWIAWMFAKDRPQPKHEARVRQF